jgi:hypothetical protein
MDWIPLSRRSPGERQGGQKDGLTEAYGFVLAAKFCGRASFFAHQPKKVRRDLPRKQLFNNEN